MVLNALKKSKISLSDYDYEKDIKNRIFMATLTIFEVEVLEEILHGSIRLPIKKLTSNFHTAEKSIISVLEKFSSTGLLKIKSDGTIIVNKEMRKYYEGQYEKFDDDFKPDMKFLKNLLRKVPIHVLPTWYSIPRSSDNIFQSIIEKYLLTPKIYSRYLMETNFENPLIKKVMQDVFEAPNLKIRSHDLRKKHSLSSAQFEEIILLLEFNFICCLSYNRIGKEWKEVVTPFHEWREFLRFKEESKPKTIAKSKVTPRRNVEFGFILDTNLFLKETKKNPLEIKVKKKPFRCELLDDSIKTLAKKCKSCPNITKNNLDKFKEHFSHIIDKLCCLKLAKVEKNRLVVTKISEKWLKMTKEEQIMFLRRHPNNCITNIPYPNKKYTKRDIHAVEKTLGAIASEGWVYFDDFLAALAIPIGNSGSVTLKKAGKRWKYELPKYSKHDIAFIKDVIYIRLFELGITTIGKHSKRDCFSLTPFGKTMLCH